MDRQERIEVSKEILKALAITSVVMASAIIAPRAAGEVAKLFEIFESYQQDKQWQYRFRARRALKRLKHQGLIVTETKGEELVVRITQAGRKLLRRYTISHMKIIRPTRWDGIWRVVVFDIAEKEHLTRDTVRGWLKRLGFARLQQSVWIIPWPCEEQFKILQSEFKLGNNAILFETSKLAKQPAIKRIFNLP